MDWYLEHFPLNVFQRSMLQCWPRCLSSYSVTSHKVKTPSLNLFYDINTIYPMRKFYYDILPETTIQSQILPICELQVSIGLVDGLVSNRRQSVTRSIGRIRVSVSTVNRTYELSGITHVTSFRKYGKHSTAPSTYGPWVRTYSKLFSCKSVLTVCSYRTQSNEIHTYGRVSRGSIPRVRRYGLLYLRTVEYDQWRLNSCPHITSLDHDEFKQTL